MNMAIDICSRPTNFEAGYALSCARVHDPNTGKSGAFGLAKSNKLCLLVPQTADWLRL